SVVDHLSLPQPRPHQFQFAARCRDTMSRLLLEDMQHVDGGGQADCIDCAIGVSVEVIHYLQHSCSAKTVQRPCGSGLPTLLYSIEREAHGALHCMRQSLEV